MACEIIRNMCLFLQYLSVDGFKTIIFLDLIELVGVISCYKDSVLVCNVERTLIHKHVSSNSNLLEREAFLLVPHPQDYFPIRLSSLFFVRLRYECVD